ncbi:NAD(P)-binding protein [Byssothecium circinans]|uniref:NAD(P)-binding protein n=1 Tax=Byssothecium circinans TaxID=147558 RepID=A0A6A5U6Q0_9PLEO|nr:NAD(P)-binding protein [Byssothecium circinans]
MATEKPITLITGGNTGIGYETVKYLYASPTAHTILLGSRSLPKAHSAIQTIHSTVPSSSEIIPIQLDIEDDASIDACYTTIASKFGKLDTLVNNAGGMFDRVMQTKPGAAGIREAWNHTYSLNVTSTEVLTHTLAPLLIKSASPRLLFITSGLSSLATTSSGQLPAMAARPPPIPAGWPKQGPPSAVAYRSSKAALNMQMLEWKRVLEADGVKVVEGVRDADAGLVVRRDGVQPW